MRVRAAALAVGLMVAGALACAAEPAKPDLARGQKIAGEVCAACHGPDGNSPLPENPKIAAQPADYLFKQLSDFKAGKERKNAIMSAIVAPLSPEDMRAVAAHYATQKARPAAAHNKETIDLGQQLYRAGNPETGVPACAGCHGPNGAGVPALFPRLSGQHAKYTATQLHAFRAGERSNDTNEMMRMIAHRLSDEEIAAVADYISGLH